MRSGIINFTVSAVVLAAGVAGVGAGEDTAFSRITGHYEAIRQALIDDSTRGIATHAEAIAADATALEGDFEARAAGVEPGDADAVREMLPEVRTSAETLAAAKDLTHARQSLAVMTRPLTRWQKLVKGPRPVVVYCPMEKKAWLQPDEPVGNPYDPSMLRCGEVVQR